MQSRRCATEVVGIKQLTTGLIACTAKMSSTVTALLYEVADLLKRERLVTRAEQQEVGRLQEENQQLQRTYAETVWCVFHRLLIMQLFRV